VFPATRELLAQLHGLASIMELRESSNERERERERDELTGKGLAAVKPVSRCSSIGLGEILNSSSLVDDG
jgi:hypothetical protein